MFSGLTHGTARQSQGAIVRIGIEETAQATMHHHRSLSPHDLVSTWQPGEDTARVARHEREDNVNVHRITLGDVQNILNQLSGRLMLVSSSI